MKHYLLTALSFVICHLSFSPAGAQAPAFPGAEGHGRYTTGGRDGALIRHVTTLNDSGTGSLRSALSGTSKKIIVFDVGGVIELKSNLTITSNTTILGQTAPSPGITLRYYTISTEKQSNIIVRFVRFRRGQERDMNDGADAATGRYGTGIIFDHCSFSWSIDEIASFYDNNNFTMQWCTVCEALHNAGHNKGNHGYGGIWGGKQASFHHNLIAHMRNRSPRFNGARYMWTGYTSNKNYSEYQWKNTVQAENVDFRNCVVYNCFNGCYGGPGGGYINIVGNYYKKGPSDNTSRVTTISVGASGNSTNSALIGMTSRYFINGNILAPSTAFDWSRVSYDDGTFLINGLRCTLDNNNYYGDSVTHLKNNSGQDCVPIQLNGPTATGMVTTHTAQTAFNKVLSYAGASLYRDRDDARYAVEALNGTTTCTGSVTNIKGQIDVVTDIPYYKDGYILPEGNGNSRPAGFDSDNDGIPDAWETANGLNPNSATDGKTKTLDPLGYYTNLEVYANSLVQDIMLSENADAIDAVADYYPAYHTEDNVLVAAINSPIDAAINAVDAAPAATEYYSLFGTRISTPTSGVPCIEVRIMPDGSRRARTVIVR